MCAVYPLQMLAEGDSRGLQLLDEIVRRYFHEGMFFQHFIHSGLNPYLTLQIAHAYLLLGNRDKFLKFLEEVLRRGTPTLTFPEAIHPQSRGGSMGDGCHGWAAAEVLSAMRSALVHERWSGNACEVVLLAGVPVEWFEPGKRISVRRAPVPGGLLDAGVVSEGDQVTLSFRLARRGSFPPPVWSVRLPFACEVMNPEQQWNMARRGGETLLVFGHQPPDREVRIRRLPQS
jgi:hypothetical protein